MGGGRLYALVGAAIGSFGLVLQFVVLVANAASPYPLEMRIVNFFSYFTILSNILVAAGLWAAALVAEKQPLAFLRRPAVRAAAVLYIATTGVVYVLLLRGLATLGPWGLLADRILHYAMPLIYIGWWAAFAPKGRVGFAAVAAFLAFPVLYGAYSLVRGPLVGWYPYPFLDVDALGWGPVFLNVVLFTLAFAVGGAVVIAIDRVLGQRGVPAAGRG
jgi:hypothetical protein